jgi:hypothetical protein
MNVGALIAFLKLVQDAGIVDVGKPSKPPSSTRPIKPNCGVGMDSLWNESTQQWQCVTEFD